MSLAGRAPICYFRKLVFEIVLVFVFVIVFVFAPLLWVVVAVIVGVAVFLVIVAFCSVKFESLTVCIVSYHVSIGVPGDNGRPETSGGSA